MTYTIAILSGKGGVGKTTISINLASTLLALGRRVVLVDGDLHTPNVELHLCAKSVTKTSYDAIIGDEKIVDVAYRHRSGIQMIPAKLHEESIGKEDFEILAGLLPDLEGTAEIVLVDMPSGLNSDVRSLLNVCSAALIITTPDLPAVTAALKAINLAESTGTVVAGVVINMSAANSFMRPEEIEGMLSKKVICIIPEEHKVRASVKLRHPVCDSSPDSEASSCIRRLAESLII
ncbi:MAG: P-loop NTPase [Candidatus Nanoarchaeia archaeon]